MWGAERRARPSPVHQSRRESWTRVVGSRRSSRVLQNDLFLHEAVMKNEADAVQGILREPVDVNSGNNYGRASTHWAVSKGSAEIMEIMEMLIGAGCDIEVQDRQGMRPVLMAAWHGQREAARLLADCGACLAAVNKKQQTLLMCAARNDRVSVIEWLAETVEDVRLDDVDADRRTALHHAAEGGHLGAVRLLVEMGALVDCADKEKRTPLHRAAGNGHSDVVEYLLARAADPNARDADGNTPLHVATGNRQTGTARLLAERGRCLDAPNERGLTALHLASLLGCRGIAETLVRRGANVDVQTKAGDTPLHLACRSNEPVIADLLVSGGADSCKLDFRLESPVHVAAQNGFRDVCRALIAAGADAEQMEQEGKTALYLAARGSFGAVVDTLVGTAELDRLSSEESGVRGKESTRGSQGRTCGRMTEGDWRSAPEGQERLRGLLHEVAHQRLAEDQWKRLALHWAFTREQIEAIESRQTGTASHKEHGFRMMLAWARGLGPEANPLEELYESLVAVGHGEVAESLRKNLEREEGGGRRFTRSKIRSCLLF